MSTVFKIVAIALVFLVGEVAFAQDRVPPYDVKGKIVFINDGDTVVFITEDHKRLSIRFQGVDAPEVAHKAYPDRPATPAQPYGYRAKDFVFRLASSKQGTVHVVEIDKYGRSVGTIFVGTKVNLNEEVAKAGLGWWYDQYYPDDARLARMEAEARDRALGLWKQADPEPPWVFRHPERKPDWEKEKCELTSRECSGGGNPTACSAKVSSKATPPSEDVTFSSSGKNECVAKALLEYQLCRGKRVEEFDRIKCTGQRS